MLKLFSGAIIFYLLSISVSIYPQTTSFKDIFNIHFEQDFEDNTIGDYLYNEWLEDWNYPTWANRDAPEEIIQNQDPENGTKVLRWNFPEGSLGPAEGGGQWLTDLGRDYDELYLSYKIKFKPGFQWVLSGKIHGLAGEPISDGFGPPDYDDGFVTLICWNETPDNNIIFYYYHQDQTHDYGDVGSWNISIETGRWYTITMRLVVNTVNNDIGNNDGILEGFVDDKLISQISNLRFRNYEHIGINMLEISTFFGGNAEEWAAQRDEWIETDDFVVFTYKDDVLVPRGNTLSPSDRVLLHPYLYIKDSLWRRSLSVLPLSSKSIELKWDHYPIPTNYLIQRKKASETVFTTIADLPYKNLTYINNNLQSETQYEYRIQANNIYSDIVSVTTYPPELPDPPSNLKASTVLKRQINISWTDNSGNELGFKVERSINSNTNFVALASLNHNINSYSDINLTPNTTYYYRVYAHNEDGNSGYSNVLEAKTLPLELPDAPSGLSASNITKNSLLLSWTDNSDNENGFKIIRSDTSGSGYVRIATVGANVTSYINEGLSPNTDYYYRVRAFNDDGNSGHSSEFSVKTLPLRPPGAPSQLSASDITKNSLNLSWIDNSDNEKGFIIEQLTQDDTVFVQIDSVEHDITNYMVNKLILNTAYFYRVIAFNDDGNSGYSDIIEVKTLDLQPPHSPSSLTASDITKNTVSLIWADNSDNETGFIIDRSISSDSNFTQIATAESDINTYTDNDLTPDVTYYYRIIAFNEDGLSDYSNILETKTLPLNPPDAPSALRADTVNDDWLTFIWTDNSTNESGFIVERTLDTTNGYSFIADISNPDITIFTDTELTDNTTYYYRVKAYNDDGSSEYSNILKVITLKLDPPQPPSLLAPSQVTLNTITLNWKDNSNNETGFIIKRAVAPDKIFEPIRSTSANSTRFIDENLNPNTTYYYLVNAINKAGNSDNSNTAIASTLSISETNRIWEGLVAYYNFNFNSDNIIYDYSNYDEPLNLFISDTTKIVWNTNNKLELLSNNYIRSINTATKIVHACKNTNEITLECWIKPSSLNSHNPGNILTITRNNDDICATLAQEPSFINDNKSYKYLIRLKTKATASNGAPNLYTRDELKFLSLHHIVYIKNNNGVEKLFVNGEEVANNIRPQNFENWDNSSYLILGNDPELNSPWNGTYYTVAIYNIALSQDKIITNYNAGPKDNLAESVINYEIEISPNPSEGIINIRIIPQSEDESADKTMIQICDIMGDLKFFEIIEDPNRELTKSLNLSNFDKGIYILRVITNDHFNSRKFVIK